MRKVLENLVLMVSVTVAFVAGAFMVLKAPQYHSNYIRDKTEESVLLMHTSEGRKIGSGFLLEHNGELVAVTNNHICENIKDEAVAITKNDKEIRLKKIKSSVDVDLCKLAIISDSKGLKGLKLANKIELGQELMVVGHPAVLPFTLARGQLIGYDKVPIMLGMVFDQASFDKCVKERRGFVVETMFGYICAKEYDGAYTTVMGLGGNSGSATVNFYGDVVGVVFAGNEHGWLILVPLSHIKEFLKD